MPNGATATPWRSAASRRSRRHAQTLEGFGDPVAASAAPASTWSRWPPASAPARPSTAPASAHRLDPPVVGERRRLRTDHLAHRVARDLHVPHDLLDRLPLDEILPPDPRYRLHDQHPPPPRPPKNEVTWTSQAPQIWTPITPQQGSTLHAVPHRGSTGPAHARRRASPLRGTPRRARVPPVDYRDKLQTSSGPFLRRHAGPISHRR